MKKIYIRNVLILLPFLVLLTSAIQNNSGPGAGYSNAPSDGNCTSCHGGSVITSGSIHNQLLLKTNFTGSGYIPDSTYTMELTFKKSSTTEFGFQLTVLNSSDNKPAGTLSTVSSPTREQRYTRTVGSDTREYIGHTSTGTSTVATDSTRWTFRWKAPNKDVGKIKFYVVGMATNNNGSNDASDEVYTKTFEFGLSNLMPVADATSSNLTTCTNYTPSINGSGTNSPTSYAWKFTGATPSTSTDQNPSVKFTSQGAQLAILTVTNNKGKSNPDTLRFTVNPSPAASITNGATGSVCRGDSLLLVGNTAANITYRWNPSNRTTKNIFVKDTGNYSVTTTSTINGCATTSSNFRLSVNAKPVVNISKTLSADTFCQSFSDTLRANGTDIDSTLWYENGKLIARVKGVKLFYSTKSSSQIYAVGKSTARCLSINSNTLKIVINNRLFPSNFNINKTTSTIQLNWNKNAGISGYRYALNNGSFNNTTTDSTLSLNGLNPNTNYSIKIRSLQNSPCNLSDTIIIVRTNACSNIEYNIIAAKRLCKGDNLIVTIAKLYKAKYSVSFNNSSFAKDTIFTFAPSKTDSLSINIIDSLSPTCPAIEEKIGFLVDTLPIDNFINFNVSSCKNEHLFTMSNIYNMYEFYKNGNLVNSSNNNAYLYSNLSSGDQLMGKGIINSCSKSFARTFTLNAASSAAYTFSRNWKTYTFTATDANNTVYNWRANNVLIGTTNPLVIDFSTYINSNVNISLATTNFQTCTDSTTQLVAVPNFTFLNTLNVGNTKLYPNPFNDVLKIETDLENFEIEIADMTGKIVYQNTNSTFVNTQSFSHGIYLVRLKQNDEIVFQQKMVK